MWFSVFQHAFSTGMSGLENAWFIYLHSCHVPLYVPAGVFIVYANTTRRFRVWRKWRRGTRTSSLSSSIHPHFISRGREVVMLYFVLNIDITSINMNIMYLQVPSLMDAGHVFLLALGYCIFSWERTVRFTNTTGWKSALSIFDVFVLIYQTFSFLVLHSPRVQSGKWLPLCLFQKSWKPKLNNPPYHFLYFFKWFWIFFPWETSDLSWWLKNFWAEVRRQDL